MDKLLDAIKRLARKPIRLIARALNKISGGHLHPNVITVFGLLMHLPIAFFIATGSLKLAAVLLVIFGLFDTLDGELARLQKRSSATGMFLDSSTDRMKEVFLYVGIVYFLVANDLSQFTVWAIAALGGSMLTSYINAWGEVVLSSQSSSHKVNQTFRSGLMRFEVRMFILLVGLLSDRLALFVVVMAIFAWVTVAQRMFAVIKRLNHVQS